MDVIHLISKWLPFKYSFVFIQISPWCVVLKLKIQKNILSWTRQQGPICIRINRRPFWNKVYKVVTELGVVQFWSEIILVISYWTCAARSFDLFTCMISDQIALLSVQLPLQIWILWIANILDLVMLPEQEKNIFDRLRNFWKGKLYILITFTIVVIHFVS